MLQQQRLRLDTLVVNSDGVIRVSRTSPDELCIEAYPPDVRITTTGSVLHVMTTSKLAAWSLLSTQNVSYYTVLAMLSLFQPWFLLCMGVMIVADIAWYPVCYMAPHRITDSGLLRDILVRGGASLTIDNECLSRTSCDIRAGGRVRVRSSPSSPYHIDTLVVRVTGELSRVSMPDVSVDTATLSCVGARIDGVRIEETGLLTVSQGGTIAYQCARDCGIKRCVDRGTLRESRDE